MDTKQQPRKGRSNFGWQHLSVGNADNGERWSVVWDIERKPDPEGHNTALEKLESSALARARHMLDLGFVVYEIRHPSGAVFLAESGLRERLGFQAVVSAA